MKKILLAALAATMLFASCTKENIKSDSNVLIVTLPDNVVPATRAVEDQVSTTPAPTITLSNVAVFLLNGNTVVSTNDFTSGEIAAKTKRIEQVPAATNRVILVANIPAAELTTVKALSNAAEILNYPYTVASQNAGGGVSTQTLIGDQATITTITDPDSPADGHIYKKADVELKALTARFEIGAVKPGKGITSVELVGIWINAFYTTAKKDVVTTNPSGATYWNTTPATSTGSSTPFGTPAVSITTAYDPAVYFDNASTGVSLIPTSKVYGYQVFAGTNIPHVILLVRGEFADGYYANENKYFLGYVTFNKYDESTTTTPSWITSIVANTIYKIGVGASGVVIDADMITDKPEKENFDLGINVTLAPWTEKTVTPGV